MNVHGCSLIPSIWMVRGCFYFPCLNCWYKFLAYSVTRCCPIAWVVNYTLCGWLHGVPPLKKRKKMGRQVCFGGPVCIAPSVAYLTPPSEVLSSLCRGYFGAGTTIMMSELVFGSTLKSGVSWGATTLSICRMVPPPATLPLLVPKPLTRA